MLSRATGTYPKRSSHLQAVHELSKEGMSRRPPPPSDHPSGRAPRSVVTRRSLPELLLVANSLAVATDDPVVLSADQNDDTLAAVALAGHLELLEKLVAR